MTTQTDATVIPCVLCKVPMTFLAEHVDADMEFPDDCPECRK